MDRIWYRLCQDDWQEAHPDEYLPVEALMTEGECDHCGQLGLLYGSRVPGLPTDQPEGGNS